MTSQYTGLKFHIASNQHTNDPQSSTTKYNLSSSLKMLSVKWHGTAFRSHSVRQTHNSAVRICRWANLYYNPVDLGHSHKCWRKRSPVHSCEKPRALIQLHLKNITSMILTIFHRYLSKSKPKDLPKYNEGDKSLKVRTISDHWTGKGKTAVSRKGA